jgi:hypothetical protein
LTYIGIELTDEAGEIAVFEIGWEKNAREFRRVPNDEAFVIRAPRNDLICGGIIYHVIRLLKKRCHTFSASVGSSG